MPAHRITAIIRPTVVIAAMLVVLAPAAGVRAQQAEEEQSPALNLDENQDVDVSRIEQILRGEDRVFRGETFTYDPAGRRDPFRSLLEGTTEGEEAKKRPPGLPGTLIEELDVSGTVETPTGIIAFAQGRDNLSYILRPGTKLYNGEVEEILQGKVIFKQYITDPKAPKPWRPVVRDLTSRQ